MGSHWRTRTGSNLRHVESRRKILRCDPVDFPRLPKSEISYIGEIRHRRQTMHKESGWIAQVLTVSRTKAATLVLIIGLVWRRCLLKTRSSHSRLWRTVELRELDLDDVVLDGIHDQIADGV